MGLGSIIKGAVKAVAPALLNIGANMLGGPLGSALAGALTRMAGKDSLLGGLAGLLKPLAPVLSELTQKITRGLSTGSHEQQALGMVLDAMLKSAGAKAPSFSA